MTRLNYLGNAMRAHWADNPSTRGKAKMAAGAALIVIGVFGLGGATKGSRKGKKRRRGGIFGNLLFLFAGGLFLIAAVSLWPDSWNDQVETDGEIASYQSGTGSDGRSVYRPIYRFEVDGQEYGFASEVTTNAEPEVGARVRIAYSASDPDQARRIDGLDSFIHWIFLALSLGLLLIAGVSIAIGLALVFFGMRLFRDGCRDLDKPSDPEASMKELRETIGQIRSGDIDIDDTAAAQVCGDTGR